MKTGIELIADERQRQIEVKGYGEERDKIVHPTALTRAAIAYCEAANYSMRKDVRADRFRNERVKMMTKSEWPFDPEYYHPSGIDTIRNLVKAGALIAAEIDKLQKENIEAL